MYFRMRSVYLKPSPTLCMCTAMLKLRQPPSFRYLAGTQAFEQIGFSMIQALLVFYLIYQKHLPDQQAFHMVATFTSLIFFSTLLGGYLSDRYLAQRFCLLTGIALQGLGYSLITFKEPGLRFSLTLIITGSALFRPNLSSFLSLFYYRQDTRRFSGYTYLYFAYQLGVACATILAAYIPKFLGWPMLYHISACTALIAFVIMLAGKKHYECRGKCPQLSPNQILPLACIALVWFVAAYFLLNHPFMCLSLVVSVGVLIFGGMGIQAIGAHYERRNRLVLIIILMICSVIFWAICYQEYLTINVFINRSVFRDLLGIHIPTVDFLALNALVSVLLCPVASSVWTQLYRKRRMPPVLIILAVSLLLLTLSMLSLGVSTHFSDSTHHVSMWWVVVSVILIAIAELILTPLAVALTTLLSPRKITGLMIGVWFMSIGLGWALAGLLANEASIPAAMLTSLVKVNDVYAHAFLEYAMLAFGSAVILIATRSFVEKKFPVRFH